MEYFRLRCVLEMIFCTILKKYVCELDFELLFLVYSGVSVSVFLERLPIIISLINRNGVLLLITGDWQPVFFVASYLSPIRVSLLMIILQRVLINKEMHIN